MGGKIPTRSQVSSSRWKVIALKLFRRRLMLFGLGIAIMLSSVSVYADDAKSAPNLTQLKHEVGVSPDSSWYGLKVYLQDVALDLMPSWRLKVRYLNYRIKQRDREQELMHLEHGLFSKEYDRVLKLRMDDEYAIINTIKENRPDIYQDFQDVLTNQIGRDLDLQKQLDQAPIKGQLEAKMDDLRAKLTAAHGANDTQKMTDTLAELEKAKAEYLDLINRIDNFDLNLDTIGQRMEDFFTGVDDPVRTSLIEKRANAEKEYAKRAGDDASVKQIDDLIAVARQAVTDAKTKEADEAVLKLQKALYETKQRLRKKAAEDAAKQALTDQTLGKPEVKTEKQPDKTATKTTPTLNKIPSTTTNSSTLELWGWFNLEGQVGVPFDRTYTGRGGLAPYHFQLDSGVGFPPHGLVLDTNGRLSGTPTVAGTSTFRVCVVDTSGANYCGTVTMVINDAPVEETPVDTPAVVTAQFVFDSASCQLTSDNGTSQVFTITAAGTMTGPVGTYYQLPYINGFFSQRSYTVSWGGGERSGSRGDSEPETTNWTFTDVEKNTQTSTSIGSTVTLLGQAGQNPVYKSVTCDGWRDI